MNTRTQVSAAELVSISMPDTVATSIGTLNFFDGVPSDDTVSKLYDNLDRMRGVTAYLDNVGASSVFAMRMGSAGVGADASNKVTITEQLLLPTMLCLTGNTSTLYALTYLDLKDEGALVVELPPGILGFLDDAWFRFIGNMGLPGPDKGKGGKYLLLPPGHTGDVPEGYFVVQMPTYHNLMFLRGSIANGLEPAVKNVKSGLRIYPLSKVENPPATEFFNISGVSFNTIPTNDYSYFEGLNQIVQEEPIEAIGPDVRGNLEAIGIVKGKPFKPDARMQKLLGEAAILGGATARAITYHPRIDGAHIYPDTHSAWTMGYANKNTSFTADGAVNADARVLFHYNATGVTPAMAMTRAGSGSDYGIAYLDANKQAFDGSRTYKLQLPPDVPVNNFWAVTIYYTQTRSLLQTSQRFPTVGSQSEGFQKNADGSYDLYFGPRAPAGKAANWLETVPGKSWFAILRMYGPLQPWIDKSWRPSEISMVE